MPKKDFTETIAANVVFFTICVGVAFLVWHLLPDALTQALFR